MIEPRHSVSSHLTVVRTLNTHWALLKPSSCLAILYSSTLGSVEALLSDTICGFLNDFAYPTTTAGMEFDFPRSVAPLVVIVAVAAVALTSVMTPSTVFMMVLPSMIVFSVIAFFLGMKHGEFRASP